MPTGGACSRGAACVARAGSIHAPEPGMHAITISSRDGVDPDPGRPRPFERRRWRRMILVGVCGGLAVGCGVFTPNNRENLRAQQALLAGDETAALEALAGRSDLPGRLD